MNEFCTDCEVRKSEKTCEQTEKGHSGYSVRPSERGKGYATCMLKMLLEKAKERRNI